MAKVKKPATTKYVCQSKSETMDAIRDLGDRQRELTRLETELNDVIADETAKRKDAIYELKVEIERLHSGVQGWCEANRVALCGDKSKTANLVTGTVSWRIRPPSVALKAVDKVLAELRRLKLTKYIRTKEEVNKDAILTDIKTFPTVAGITITSGVEDFIIEPAEINVTEGV